MQLERAQSARAQADEALPSQKQAEQADPLDTVNLAGNPEAAAQIPALAGQLDALVKSGAP